jgi:hypothetical protein
MSNSLEKIIVSQLKSEYGLTDDKAEELAEEIIEKTDYPGTSGGMSTADLARYLIEQYSENIGNIGGRRRKRFSKKTRKGKKRGHRRRHTRRR